MRKRKADFGERIANLEVFYGSQKKLAKSLGVSTRTLRRWKKRETPPDSGGTVYVEKKTKRREYYHTREKPKHQLEVAREKYPLIEPERISSGVLRLNDHIRGEALQSLAISINDDYPKLFNRLIKERPNIEIVVSINGKEVDVPAKNWELMLRESNSEMRRYIVLGSEYRDENSLKRQLWVVFEKAYNDGKKAAKERKRKKFRGK